MTVPNPAIGMPSDEQKKQIEEWHQRLPKCGCGRVGRYETSTGLACNKYMRCDNAEFMAAQIEQLRTLCDQLAGQLTVAMAYVPIGGYGYDDGDSALSEWRQWKGEV